MYDEFDTELDYLDTEEEWLDEEDYLDAGEWFEEEEPFEQDLYEEAFEEPSEEVFEEPYEQAVYEGTFEEVPWTVPPRPRTTGRTVPLQPVPRVSGARQRQAQPTRVKINKCRGRRGVAVSTTARFRPRLNDPIDIVIACTSVVEGGYDRVYTCDRGIMSWGIFQWPAHVGKLQKILYFIKSNLITMGRSSLWTRLFPGLDVQRKRSGRIYLLYKGVPRRTIRSLRRLFRGSVSNRPGYGKVIRYWARVFAIAGRNPIIQRLQREYARREVLSVFRKRVRRRTIRDYIGKDLRMCALFFAMWNNLPKYAYRYLGRAIDETARYYGTYNISRWGKRWQTRLRKAFERRCRRSTIGNWPVRIRKVLRHYRLLTAGRVYTGIP